MINGVKTNKGVRLGLDETTEHMFPVNGKI